jgi:S1-C subfamily serine protease
LTAIETFDADDKPILMFGCCARITYAYDDKDRQIAVTYLDAQYREVPLEVSVTLTVPGSTAERVGLRPDDRIVSYNGVRITAVPQLGKLTADRTGGARTLVVRRAGKPLTLTVPAGPLGVVLGTSPVGSRAIR